MNNCMIDDLYFMSPLSVLRKLSMLRLGTKQGNRTALVQHTSLTSCENTKRRYVRAPTVALVLYIACTHLLACGHAHRSRCTRAPGNAGRYPPRTQRRREGGDTVTSHEGERTSSGKLHVVEVGSPGPLQQSTVALKTSIRARERKTHAWKPFACL